MSSLTRKQHEQITLALKWRDELQQLLVDENEAVRIIGRQSYTLDLSRHPQARTDEVTAIVKTLIANVDKELAGLGMDTAAL